MVWLAGILGDQKFADLHLCVTQSSVGDASIAQSGSGSSIRVKGGDLKEGGFYGEGRGLWIYSTTTYLMRPR